MRSSCKCSAPGAQRIKARPATARGPEGRGPDWEYGECNPQEGLWAQQRALPTICGEVCDGVVSCLRQRHDPILRQGTGKIYVRLNEQLAGTSVQAGEGERFDLSANSATVAQIVGEVPGQV